MSNVAKRFCCSAEVWGGHERQLFDLVMRRSTVRFRQAAQANALVKTHLGDHGQGSSVPRACGSHVRRHRACRARRVSPTWNNQAMHDALLADANEERATLLVRPEAMPARMAFERWGYARVGAIRPWPEALYDAMVLNLRRRGWFLTA
jgi:hypothetical protein